MYKISISGFLQWFLSVLMKMTFSNHSSSDFIRKKRGGEKKRPYITFIQKWVGRFFPPKLFWWKNCIVFFFLLERLRKNSVSHRSGKSLNIVSVAISHIAYYTFHLNTHTHLPFKITSFTHLIVKISKCKNIWSDLTRFFEHFTVNTVRSGINIIEL